MRRLTTQNLHNWSAQSREFPIWCWHYVLTGKKVTLASEIAHFMGSGTALNNRARIALVDPCKRVILLECRPIPYRDISKARLFDTPERRDLVVLAPYSTCKQMGLGRVPEHPISAWCVDSKRVIPLDQSIAESVADDTRWHWQPLVSDEQYTKDVAELVQQIRAGRFYQTNLLRHYVSESTWSDRQIAQRLLLRGGPYSAWIRTSDFELVSFSPERFVTIHGDADGAIISTFPIKGTAPRSQNESHDSAAAAALLQSPKDRAELNMIVDLMRNDLYPICQKQSIDVVNAGSLKTFKYVHHLEAEIRGRLRNDVVWSETIDALCPAGSITGAPKREVMIAIDEIEGMDRGLLMGNIFFVDSASHTLQSSVLIRTMQRVGTNPWHFAAGSGIVVKSEPHLERMEVDAKCQVVRD